MDRAQFLQELDTAWAEVIRASAGISDAALRDPGFGNDWSAADFLGHIATWEEEVMKSLNQVLAGKMPLTYENGDAFNKAEVERKRRMPPSQLRGHLEETHRHLRQFVADLPEIRYARPGQFSMLLRGETIKHYAEHSQQILAWRQAHDQ